MTTSRRRRGGQAGCYSLLQLFLPTQMAVLLFRVRPPTGSIPKAGHAVVAVTLGFVAYMLIAYVHYRIGRLSILREIEGPIPGRLLRILIPIDLALAILICLGAYPIGSAILFFWARTA